MAQQWTYYTPLLLHKGDGRIGFTVRFAVFEHRLDEDLALAALAKWARELTGVVPQDKDDLPVIALGWQLLDAKQGPGVEPLKPKEDKGNGQPT